MSLEGIIAIITSITTILATVVGWLNHIKGFLKQHAATVIDDTENKGKSGEEKLMIAVDALLDKVPTVLKPLIPRAWVEKTVQEIFDKIESYAQKQK